MLENVFGTEELRSLARRKIRDREFRTVRNDEVPHLEQGWESQRQNKTSTRVSRIKRREDLLEDRVWSVLYAMGFTHLSGEGGAHLHLDPKRGRPQEPDRCRRIRPGDRHCHRVQISVVAEEGLKVPGFFGEARPDQGALCERREPTVSS